MNTNTPAVKTEEKKYQHYKSSRVSMRMITTTGRMIAFTNYQFITCDQDLISYLDDEIGKGVNVVTKGELLTHSESDPMEALKRKHIAEYLEKEAEELKQQALGEVKDMGNTKSQEVLAASLKPASSGKVVGGKDNISK